MRVTNLLTFCHPTQATRFQSRRSCKPLKRRDWMSQLDGHCPSRLRLQLWLPTRNRGSKLYPDYSQGKGGGGAAFRGGLVEKGRGILLITCPPLLFSLSSCFLLRVWPALQATVNLRERAAHCDKRVILGESRPCSSVSRGGCGKGGGREAAGTLERVRRGVRGHAGEGRSNSVKRRMCLGDRDWWTGLYHKPRLSFRDCFRSVIASCIPIPTLSR